MDGCVLTKSISKSYTTENAYLSHVNSKRHKEAETKYNVGLKKEMDAAPTEGTLMVPVSEVKPLLGQEPPARMTQNAGSQDIEMTIEQRVAQARTRLSTSDCLFCPTHSGSIASNLTHMSVAHGFFIPDAEYLVDVSGLIAYLGEKIAVGNACIYCYGKKRRNANAMGKINKDEVTEEGDIGREFRGLEATRRHMVDKAHCKIAFESEEERLEISDYYDFTSSYPANSRRNLKKAKNADDWEEIEDGGNEEADEMVEDNESDSEESDSDAGPGIRIGDTPYELVLPSGARIGHRSLRHYYKQNYRTSLNPEPPSEEDPKSGAALVRHLLSQKNSALVPVKGGFGAFGEGGTVVKARNAGEARNAGRHVREFRDMKKREDFKTKVAFIANSQKHFRDPLLQ
jgi:pre-60S factor REI1